MGYGPGRCCGAEPPYWIALGRGWRLAGSIVCPDVAANRAKGACLIEIRPIGRS